MAARPRVPSPSLSPFLFRPLSPPQPAAPPLALLEDLGPFLSQGMPGPGCAASGDPGGLGQCLALWGLWSGRAGPGPRFLCILAVWPWPLAPHLSEPVFWASPLLGTELWHAVRSWAVRVFLGSWWVVGGLLVGRCGTHQPAKWVVNWLPWCLKLRGSEKGVKVKCGEGSGSGMSP